MNDDDDKRRARGGSGSRGGGSDERWGQSAPSPSGSKPDGIPSRNTAPAGTPAHRPPPGLSTEPRAPSPVPLAPLPAEGKEPSDRPPVDTATPPRTVGGQTARLKARTPKDDDPAQPARARRPPEMKSRQASDDAAQDRPRGAAASPRSKDNWEADVKISPEPENPGSSRRKQSGPREADVVLESRWPYTIAIGAVAFAVGCLLPLFFRRHIMPDVVQASSSEVTQGASRPASSATPPATTSTQTAAVQAPSSSTAVKASAPIEPVATGTASATTPVRGGKPSGKPAGKGGRVGDIF